MKAVLVIDMPKSCKECLFCGFGGVNLEKYVCCLTGEHSESSHLVGCPLRPLPQKKDIYGKLTFDKMAEYIGYNACLEEITGEKEDCRGCQEWESCPCGKIGYDKGTSIGYSIGECKHYKEKQNERFI